LSAFTPKQLGLLAGLAASAIWGGMYVISKVVLAVIPPFSLLSLRLLLGCLTLAAWLAWKRQLPRLPGRQWVQVLGVGFIGYGLSLGMQFAGTRLSTAANGAVVTAATPAFVFLFAYLILGEKISQWALVALGLSSLGVLAVIDPSQAQLSPQLWRGNLILVGAAITWGLYSVLVRRSTRQLAALPFTLVALLGGLILALPIAALELSRAPMLSFSAGLIGGVLYLGLVATALAAFLWNWTFEHLEAGLASLTFFAQPLVGAALGAVFLGERLTPLFLVGASLILFALWVGSRRW
jgi:drug/metabolite transporter (DMT)-like permease